jgi:excinuclease ABC subunit C
MSQKNAQEYISVSIEKIEQKTKFTMGACEDLRAALGLSVTPKKIECFDISHMGGEGVVASMAVFIDGAPAKKLYRKFKLRHGEGNNDFLSMQEVLSRRLNRVGGTDDSFATLPDLIVIDGGKGQVSSVRDLIEPKCAFIGFGGEYDSVVLSNGKEIILDRHSYALHLLERIRDEAHRFAVGYQKKVYKNKSMS